MFTDIEYVSKRHIFPDKIKVAVFDFDGTISTLRCGWEDVMRPMMLEFISGGKEYGEVLEKKVDAYIDESTGIQTVYQMMWLRDEVQKAGFGRPEQDEWWYKREYNRRLMEQVKTRTSLIESGKARREDYTIAGAKEFLTELKNNGVVLYLASGTDHGDMANEAKLLGVYELFTEVRGAPENAAACSKEAVLGRLFEEMSISPENVLVVGDGKVEIALGAKYGAYTLGAATNEKERCGVNKAKRKRLIAAGADMITGDFLFDCKLKKA